MKIVVTDGYTSNPGDQSWDGFEEFGELTVYDRTSPEDVVARCQDAEIIITNKVVLDRNVLERLPKLRYIGVIATGYNVVDLDYTRERGIVVTNIPNYCTNSVAQIVFAHMMELARRVGHHSDTVKQGKWKDCPDFCYWDFTQVELTGKTMGLIGCGNIGRAVAKIAQALDMRVIAYDLYPSETPGIEFVDQETVLREADVVSLHCPLTPENEGFVNSETLAKMKATAFLINTGRGPLVNEADLAQALKDGVIAGAGLDVLCVEPPETDNPLFDAPNCFITPHIAWASHESRARLLGIACDNIRAFLDGKAVNVVNGL